MNLRIITASDVIRLLPMAEAIEAMAGAFAELSAGRAVMPQRVQVRTAAGTMLVMPAHLPESQATCVKIVSVCPGNAEKGLPVVTGLVVVLDGETGQPVAILDGHRLTSIRSGAAGGLAARLLSRENSATVALFGAGEQARAQLQGVRAVRSIQRVLICSRTRAAAERLAAEFDGEPNGPEMIVCDDRSWAVRESDLIVTATSSATPVFAGRDLQPGTHITAVGSFTPRMRELDTLAVARSRVFVDHRAAALAEAGELIAAGVTDAAEIGEVVLGLRPGRQDPAEITLFKSVGVAVQDAAAAHSIWSAACRLDLGALQSLS